MARETVVAELGPKKCHFFNSKTDIRECHLQKCCPRASKTIGAEREGIVVVGFACMACIIFLSNFVFFIFFHQMLQNVLVWKIHRSKWQTRFAFSSRTGGQKLHFCLSTVNESILIILLLAWVRVHILHCSASSRASFERLFFQKQVQIIQQNV